MTTNEEKSRAERIHTLKTDREVFQAVRDGRKTFEIRLNDRAFRVGDTLILHETVHTGEEMRAGAPLQYTGCELKKTVSHVLSGYGLMDGWVCLSFAAQRTASTAAQPEAVARDWSVERHGNGWAIYRGRNESHHGWNLGQLTECDSRLPIVIERALNAADRPAPTPAPEGGEARARPEYCWSLHEDESFTGSHDSVEGALDEAQDDLIGNCEPGEKATVYVGEATPALSYLRPEWVGEWVCEHLDEYLCDNHVGADDPIIKLDKSGNETLGRIVIDWLDANGKIWRHGVENIKPHEVIVEDRSAPSDATPQAADGAQAIADEDDPGQLP